MTPRDVIKSIDLSLNSMWVWAIIGICFALGVLGVLRLVGAFPQHYSTCTTNDVRHVVAYVNSQLVRCTKP